MLDIRTIKPGALLEIITSAGTHLNFLENDESFFAVEGFVFMYLGYELGTPKELYKKMRLGAGTSLILDGVIRDDPNADILGMKVLINNKVRTAYLSYFPNNPVESEDNLPPDFFDGNYLINFAGLASPPAPE